MSALPSGQIPTHFAAHAPCFARSPVRVRLQPARYRAETGGSHRPRDESRERGRLPGGGRSLPRSLLHHRPAQPTGHRARPARRHRHPRRRVDRHQPPPAHTNQPYRVFLHDKTGELALTFFRVKGNWLEKALPIDEQVMVSGKVDWFNGRASMVHPDLMVKVSDAGEMPLVEPVYPLTAGLVPKVMRRAVEGAVARLPRFPEWMDEPCRNVRACRMWRTPSASCTIRAMDTISIRRRLPGEGWRTMSFSPARYRWHWCASACARPPAARSGLKAASVRRSVPPYPFR